MYRTGTTIKETLDQIHRHDLVLPAIQREFVWKPDQVCRFFDSIMQGYPFGTFLYWSVEPENSGKFKFFDFVRDYHERDRPHCPPLGEVQHRRLTAVLDGQQRLTALNVGLRGSMARKLPHKWWNNPRAFPVRKLHLDLLWVPDEEDEEGLTYRFNFLTEGEAGSPAGGVCWFPVRRILSMENAGPAMSRWLNAHLNQENVDEAFEKLFQLYEVVHSKHLIAYYEEERQDLDKALQIFIRTNDGGTPLSHSDLLLSIAVAQWTNYDARQEIHNLVDDLNRIGVGFRFTKNLVLKAGLMLSNIGSVGFRVKNFNRHNMEILEKNWAEIKQALRLTVQLVSSYGFNGQNLTAQNSILPIAYYLFCKRPPESFLTHSQYQADRQAIRGWLIRSLLKSGVWGSGLDTLLTDLRLVINQSGRDGYPTHQLGQAMTRRGRPLLFDEEEIEDLVDMRYSDRLTFALLSLLFPFIDLQNQFHIDHIYPQSRFSRKRLMKAGFSVETSTQLLSECQRLGNLQLLQGNLNNEKRAKMPKEWLEQAYPDPINRQEYQELHLLGDVPGSIQDFEGFYKARRSRMRDRIGKLLGRRPLPIGPGSSTDEATSS